jgi:hypothetical protein
MLGEMEPSHKREEETFEAETRIATLSRWSIR